MAIQSVSGGRPRAHVALLGVGHTVSSQGSTSLELLSEP